MVRRRRRFQWRRRLGKLVKMFPKNIQDYLSPQDIREISEAVQKAEAKTSGEIVPVIVRRSSSVGHVPMILTLILLLLTVACEFPWKDKLFATPWLWLWPVLGVVYYFLSQFLAQSFTLQRLLTVNSDEIFQVERRAQLEFFLNRVNRTKAGTGILIFISVMERRAVILADEGIHGKIPPEVWVKLVDQLTEKLRRGEWKAAFLESIEACGDLLSTHFPASQHDTNELSNQLVIKG